MIVGIDLGTTNSLIGSYVSGNRVLFPNVSGSFLTPSFVSLDEDGIIVGEAARDRLITHPDRSVGAFKRWMGTSRETQLGQKSFRAEELSSFILRSLMADAEAATGERPTEAVISVPAYFSDAQRNATRIAGELAGLKVERLINEPTAAALAYGLEKRDREARFLVFDLGGGTFDVSIVEIFDGVVEVHATAGDNFLGGNDFLDLLVDRAASDLGLDYQRLPPADQLQMRRRLDLLKAKLSTSDTVELKLSLSGKDYSWEFNQEQFAELSTPLVQRMRLPLERALRDANLSGQELDEIVLVGGATRMPLVVKMVTRLLGKLPLRTVNPDEVVAHGAVVASGLKDRNEALQEIILTDVCPYTLGLEVMRRDPQNVFHDGYFEPIINRGTTVPVSREKTFYPISETQQLIRCQVYQGESPRVEKNILLGSLEVPLPSSNDPEARSIQVRYTYDINGVLQVETTVTGTGEVHELIFERTPGAMTPEELRASLEKLSAIKVHPRARHENLQIIARAERVFEEYLDHRDMLTDMILAFKSILESQDDRRIAEVRKLIEIDLDRIEKR
ncbi:molecular chaperone HscC [Oryzifoliimicrobium ureilyticus]|uniref:molecular chaperone HscC n=1 Tax=Oryzifoliimicrobium ureilyticus TaxID=3113724 RepID=UPI00307610B1